MMVTTAGTYPPHFGGSGMLDVVAYVAFFAVIAICLWFLDSTLKNEND